MHGAVPGLARAVHVRYGSGPGRVEGDESGREDRGGRLPGARGDRAGGEVEGGGRTVQEPVAGRGPRPRVRCRVHGGRHAAVRLLGVAQGTARRLPSGGGRLRRRLFARSSRDRAGGGGRGGAGHRVGLGDPLDEVLGDRDERVGVDRDMAERQGQVARVAVLGDERRAQRPALRHVERRGDQPVEDRSGVVVGGAGGGLVDGEVQGAPGVHPLAYRARRVPDDSGAQHLVPYEQFAQGGDGAGLGGPGAEPVEAGHVEAPPVGPGGVDLREVVPLAPGQRRLGRVTVRRARPVHVLPRGVGGEERYGDGAGRERGRRRGGGGAGHGATPPRRSRRGATR